MTVPRHSLLARQLKQFFSGTSGLPPQWQAFLDAVDKAYKEADADRGMLERSLELSSQELLQANSEMRAVVQAFPDIFFLLAPDGTILDHKGGNLTDFYLPPEQLVGKRIQDMPMGDVGQQFAAAIRDVSKGKAMVSLEYALGVKDRDDFYEARLVPIHENQILAIVRNISERKLGEQTLEQSLSLLRATLESTADGILVVDREGHIISYNQKFLAMWQVPESVLPLRSDKLALDSVVHQLKDPERFLAKIQSLYSQPEAESYDVLEFKDGRSFERYSQPHRLGIRCIGRVWSFRDITRRKQLEEQLHQTQKMEAIGKLAGGIAHDFNNILTAILGYGSQLRHRAPNEARLQRPVVEICRAAERAAGLTRQLLAFSRRQVLQPKALEINAVVTNMVGLFQRLIGEHITIFTRLDPAVGPIKADQVQLEQVLVNLAVNARDAMPDGGVLTLETTGVVLDRPTASRLGCSPGAYVRLTVRDTGCGMAPEVLPHCFEPFFTTKPIGKGTGLGLSTVYGIVQQSGGAIEIDSAVGQGASFRIYLPGALRLESPQAQRTEELTPGLGTETILLVEDEVMLRELIREALEESGYLVLEADGVDEALRLGRQHAGSIHLLLTDVVMPGMSGQEVAHRLLKLNSRIKVLYMSGYTDDAIVRHGVLEKGIPFLQKPFTPADLERKVREVLTLPMDSSPCSDEPFSAP